MLGAAIRNVCLRLPDGNPALDGPHVQPTVWVLEAQNINEGSGHYDAFKHWGQWAIETGLEICACTAVLSCQDLSVCVS